MLFTRGLAVPTRIQTGKLTKEESMAQTGGRNAGHSTWTWADTVRRTPTYG